MTATLTSLDHYRARRAAEKAEREANERLEQLLRASLEPCKLCGGVGHTKTQREICESLLATMPNNEPPKGA